jgi:hypothetical protein
MNRYENEEPPSSPSGEVNPISPLLIVFYVLLGGLIGGLLIFLFKNLFIENIKKNSNRRRSKFG